MRDTPGTSDAERAMNREAETLMDYRLCEVCGQRFDTRDLDQVFHHGPEHHVPLEPVQDVLSPA